MDRIGAIDLFVRVVDGGSFSAAARTLGIGQPAVSKQIAALEAHLGAQLLQRTSRSLTLTEAGRDFYQSGVRLLGDLEAAESRVGRGRIAPSGLVRATVAPVFGRLTIVPQLHAFFGRYPDVAVELVVADRLMNLVEEGIDLGVHNGELIDSTLIASKIAETPVITVATPAYLAAHGEPATPAELAGHACISYAPQGVPRAWGFAGRFGPLTHQPPGAPSVPTMPSRSARRVLTGLGLARTRRAGCLRRRSRRARCGGCSATTSRRRWRSARSDQAAASWPARSGCSSTSYGRDLRGGRPKPRAAGRQGREAVAAGRRRLTVAVFFAAYGTQRETTWPLASSTSYFVPFFCIV